MYHWNVCFVLKIYLTVADVTGIITHMILRIEYLNVCVTCGNG